jgi:hypothetical protein
MLQNIMMNLTTMLSLIVILGFDPLFLTIAMKRKNRW